ncbi:oligopeptide/dipeptide ABC transporter ATP-binding protein, partial [Plastoroseomonas hellenica]|nr:ABC transporter ATP-binding protein [Plastoroseomonas hellenica]
PARPPAGCAFHPRCPHAEARCGTEPPGLAPAATDHAVACHLVAEDRLP